MARSQPRTTSEQKRAFLWKSAKKFAHYNHEDFLTLCDRLAHEMKDAGMFSPKTGIRDIAWNIQKHVYEWGWRLKHEH